MLLLVVRGQTTLPHNMLLYLIWLFNYKPLADCRSSGSRLERTLYIFPVKALSKSPPHVASLAEPRATREISGPSSCRYPALTDASVLTMPPAVVVRQSLVSGSAIPHVNSFLSGHVSPPHAPLASTEHRPLPLSFKSVRACSVVQS